MDVMGLESRPPTPDEIRRMGRVVRQAMEDGAVGLSSGLDYIPSRYADTAELTALCREIAPYGGVYVTHMRGYAPDSVIRAMDEVFSIARSRRRRLITSTARPTSAPAPRPGRASGLDVAFDPTATSPADNSGMIALPPWVRRRPTRRSRGSPIPRCARGSAPRLLRPSGSAGRGAAELRRGAAYRAYEGLTLAEAARRATSRAGGRRSSTSCAMLVASALAVAASSRTSSGPRAT
jgi:N-acyl-D-amino-acid deacylase